MIKVEPLDARKPEVRALLDEADAFSKKLYPADGRRPVDQEFLASPAVRLFVARIEKQAVGCAALVLAGNGCAELKRMIVRAEARGRGAGHCLIKHIEAAALAGHVRTIMLETGPLNREALSLYRRCGYRERGPFGSYCASPHSVFMEKRLLAQTRNPSRSCTDC